MFDASQPSSDRPRSWKPLAGAGGAAVLVLVIALSTVFLGDNLTETQEATIEACEAEFAGTQGTPYVGGSIYVPTEMREYYAVAETHGEVPEPLDDVSQEVLANWEAAGEHWIETGEGPVVLVWRHEDDTYSQCSVDFDSAGIVQNSVELGPLVAPRHG